MLSKIASTIPYKNHIYCTKHNANIVFSQINSSQYIKSALHHTILYHATHHMRIYLCKITFTKISNTNYIPSIFAIHYIAILLFIMQRINWIEFCRFTSRINTKHETDGHRETKG